MGFAETVLSTPLACGPSAQVVVAADNRGDPLLAARRPAVANAAAMFPPVSTVRRWFYLWRDNGQWLSLNHALLLIE